MWKSAPAAFALLLSFATAACLPPRSAAIAEPASALNTGTGDDTSDAYEFVPVPVAAASLLGCNGLGAVSAPPVCQVALPSAEEDSAFRAEGRRLENHGLEQCRVLGGAVSRSVPTARMYRKALIRNVDGRRWYGVGHAYALGDAWLVRVARRLDDLNGRTLDEMKRTLRHEVSHTLGATENSRGEWTADDYTNGCA